MKVNIGPYKSDIITLRGIERRYEMWRSGSSYLDEKEFKWYDKIVFGLFDRFEDLVRPINRWSNNRNRKIKIHIDNYDVWGAHHTLALIIHPVLVKLKQQQHGYPHVDNEDVPEELRFLDPETSNQWSEQIDEKHQARWNWVIDEMIWAFEQYSTEDDTDRFHHNVDQLEMIWTPLEDNPGLNSVDFNYQKDTSKPRYWVDEEGKKKHNERKQNGLRLFARYYESLWD